MIHISFFNACLVVQIFTELCPISSSGHIVLFQAFVTDFFLHNGMNTNPPFLCALIQLAHLVTAGQICFFYRKNIMHLNKKTLYRLFPSGIHYIGPIIAADLVTATFFIFKRYVQVSSDYVVVGFALTGIILCAQQLLSKYVHTNNNQLSYAQGIILGLAQGLAFFPGLSRLAMVFSAARLLGLSTRAAFALSWIIYIPLILGSSLIAVLSLICNSFLTTSELIIYILTSIGAGILSYPILCNVYLLAQEEKLWYFSVYLLVPFLLALLHRN